MSLRTSKDNIQQVEHPLKGALPSIVTSVDKHSPFLYQFLTPGACVLYKFTPYLTPRTRTYWVSVAFTCHKVKNWKHHIWGLVPWGVLRTPKHTKKSTTYINVLPFLSICTYRLNIANY